MLFLSYSENDQEIAAEIAAWFAARRIAIFNWLAPEMRGGRFLEKIQEAMSVADDFLALMSPHYLDSYWCQREKDLALQREKDLRAEEPGRTFIHVLNVAETPLGDMGFLRDYDHITLAEDSDIETVLAALNERLVSRERKNAPAEDPGEEASELYPGPDSSASPTGPLNTAPSVTEEPDQPIFRNRENELERVLGGLTNSGGPHFWLLVAPPQLGKTWFVGRVRTEITGWSTSLVDLRKESAEVRASLAELVSRLFDIAPPASVGADERHAIAVKICKSGRSHLCVIDGAELLDQATTNDLRECLSEIYRLIDEAAGDVRLGLVVASRKEDGWRGATPHPRVSALRLSEFSVSVVNDALVDLAHATIRHPYQANLRPLAVEVHGATEGLPGLLSECLRWIQDRHWVGLDNLADQEQFKQLVQDYVSGHLLARDSLMPGPGVVAGEVAKGGIVPALHTLEQACRALVPYRLFTQSHVRYQLDSDREFGAAVAAVGWSMEDLWDTISAVALLVRPLDEPWQEIHPAIRRLLYRYFYVSSATRSESQNDARRFVEVWGEQQYGKEQIVGLVECLWHEAMALRDLDRQNFAHRLTASAGSLSRNLKQSPLYTVEELRHYASDRMKDDDELGEALSRVSGLLAELAEIVRNPVSET